MINEKLIPTLFHLVEAPVNAAESVLHFLFLDRDFEALVTFTVTFAALVMLYRWVRGSTAKPYATKWSECRPIWLFAAGIFLTALFGWQSSRGLPFTKTIPLKPKNISYSDGFAYKYTFNKEELSLIGDPSKAWLSDGPLPLLPMARAVKSVREQGQGNNIFSTRSYWFSAKDNSNPAVNNHIYKLHYPQVFSPWFLRGSYLLTGVALILVVLDRRSRTAIKERWQRYLETWSKRDQIVPMTWRFWWPGLLVAAVFTLAFTTHQWRYRNQDSRMQIITSRPDDGLLMERIRWVADKKTMDPWTVQINSYGALSFIPAALPTYVATKLGVTVSDHFIALSSRIVKTLLSALGLLAIYAFGARYFSVTIGWMAAALVGTNLDFLIYTSYPFYPDAFMAGCNSIGLLYAFSLIEKPDSRRVFFAAAWCGVGFGIKFLAAISGPLIVVCALIGHWRTSQGDRKGAALRFIGDGALAASLFGFMFLLTNPYLDYLSNWVIPNCTKASNAYSGTNPMFMQTTAPGLDRWLSSLNGFRNYDSPAILAFYGAAFGLILLFLVQLFRRSKDNTVPLITKTLLFGYVCLYLAYLVKSITVAIAIDGRFFLLIIGLLYLLGLDFIFAVCRLLGRAIDKLPVKLPFVIRHCVPIALLAVTACVIVLTPRAKAVWSWASGFGQPLPYAGVAKWLREYHFPADAHIVSGLKPYVPLKYRLNSGWRWMNVQDELNKTYRAGVYIENKRQNDVEYLSTHSREKMTDDQWKFYSEQRQFYTALRAEKVVPFIYAGTGQELVSPNANFPDLSTYNIFVDRYLWTPNLIDPKRGALLRVVQNIPETGENAASVMLRRHAHDDDSATRGEAEKFPQSVTINLRKASMPGMLAIAWEKAEWFATDFTLEAQAVTGEWLTLATRTQWLNPEKELVTYVPITSRVPVDRVRFTVTATGGRKQLRIRELALYPVAPFYYNNTALNFNLKEVEGSCTKEHPLTEAFVERTADRFMAFAKPDADVLSFALEPKRPLLARRLLLVFHARIDLPQHLQITLEQEGKAPIEIKLNSSDVLVRGTNHPFVEIPVPADALIQRATIKLEGRTNNMPLALRQCSLEAAEPEVAKLK